MIKAYLLLLLFVLPEAYSAIDAYTFPNTELRDRHSALIEELRCPQCLNTNLAGSDSMIASDLRREVRKLLLEGKTDAEILDFMYQRYGDFILYKPRVQGGTLVLWFAPIILFLLVLLILFRLVKSKTIEVDELTPLQAERLKKLTGEKE